MRDRDVDPRALDPVSLPLYATQSRDLGLQLMDANTSTSGEHDVDALLSYLGRWLADYAGPPELVVGLERGSERSDCAVGWLTAEGPAAFGHLTLWDSGDVAIEVYDDDTAEFLLRSRGRVTTVAELAAHLCAFVVSCAPVARTRVVMNVGDNVGPAAIGATPSIQRRLHR